MKIRPYIEEQNGLGWKQPYRSLSSNLLPWAGTTLTKLGDWMKSVRETNSLP